MLRIILAGLMLISQQLYSQSLNTVVQLDEVLVAYKADQLTPVTFQDLKDSALISQPSIQEPSFLLAKTPSITSYSDNGSYEGYSYFRLRGIDQTRVNITLNGVPLNEPEDQGAYLANYPDLLNSIQNIQIQRGVSISKNGSASYVGSVQLFSPNLYDQSKSSISLGGGSFNTGALLGEYGSGPIGKAAFYVRGSRIYSDGYKEHAFTNSGSLFFSGGLLFNTSSLKLNIITAQHSNGQAWNGVSKQRIEMNRRTNGNSAAETDNFVTGLFQLQHDWSLSENSSLQSSIYYNRLDGNYNFDLGNYIADPTINEIYNYNFVSNQFGLYSNYSYWIWRLETTVGVHASVYDRRHLGSERDFGFLYSNTGYKKEGSVFLKVNYALGNVVNLFGDIQYRTTSFDYKGSVELKPMNWEFLNPKAGVSLEVGPKALLYYSIGSIGREPTRNDMFGGNDDLLADSLGNAILFMKDPERVVDQEFGYRLQTDRFSLNANLYYMDFHNEIVLDGKFGPNGLALTDAVDKSTRSGVELSASYQLTKHILLTNNSSYNYSKIKDQDIQFTPILTPPVVINQEVAYTGKKGFTFAVAARYQDKSFINFSNTSRLEEYLTFNVRTSMNITEDLQASIFVNNITNVKYFNSGYEDFDGSAKYFVTAPTNFYVSLKYNL